MSLTSEVLPAGQYGWVHDLRQVADATAAGAVALAQRAGLRGILAKYNDGHALSHSDGEQWQGQCRALAPACAAAGLLLIPWGYVYPDDTNAAFGAIVAQALADTALTNPQGFYVLDAEIEFDNDPQADAHARVLIGAIRATTASIRLLYTSWGWPDQHPGFPWGAFQGACDAFLPQVYPGEIAAGVDMGTYWNRAYGGPQYGGPAPGSGPVGYSALLPQRPVVPTFDFGGDTAELARLANNGGFPAITWWVMDGMTDAEAAVLASTPYARHVTAPPPQAPPSPPAGQQSAPDVAAALSALSQAEAALQAARKALGG
jgi:hypothetical protein